MNFDHRKQKMKLHAPDIRDMRDTTSLLKAMLNNEKDNRKCEALEEAIDGLVSVMDLYCVDGEPEPVASNRSLIPDDDGVTAPY